MKKLLVALSCLLAPAAFAGPYTLTVHNYTNKTFHWHQDANTNCFGNMGSCINDVSQTAFDMNVPPAIEEYVTPSTVTADYPTSTGLTDSRNKRPGALIIKDAVNQIGFNCAAGPWSLDCTSDMDPAGTVQGGSGSFIHYKSSITAYSRFTAPRLSFLLEVSGGDISTLNPEYAKYELSIYPSIIEEQQRNQKVLDALNKTINSKLDALNTTIDSTVKNEVQHTDVVQTSVNNFLTTTSGNQTNLVNAVSTAMQSARDAAASDTKDYGPNNFYPSMTKQSADGKYLVYPAQAFTLSGGCTLNAAPNNYLMVAHDANQEKNATQLLTAMVLGRRVEITQHQKDLETTDCGVIDSVKILDK